MRPLLLATLVTALAAGCGGHGQTAPATPRPNTKSSIIVRLSGQSHHPRVGQRWHYEVRVTNANGTPIAANVHLQILFGGVPVGQVGRHHIANGIWRETLGAPGNSPFPARARGQPLVFQAVVTAKGETKKANYWIRVR